jgi:hypothetical protein
MASFKPVVVHVEKPAEILLSKYFVEMRIWLDAHNITPLDFHLFGGLNVGLEIRFSSPEQASLFEREFGAKVQPTTVVAPGRALIKIGATAEGSQIGQAT